MTAPAYCHQRTVTATGRLISTIPLGNTVRLELLMAADAEVEIHERSGT